MMAQQQAQQIPTAHPVYTSAAPHGAAAHGGAPPSNHGAWAAGGGRPSAAVGSGGASEEQLVGMGFPRARVVSALSLHGGDFESALNQLVSEDNMASNGGGRR
jgi:hypothetical protein